MRHASLNPAILVIGLVLISASAPSKAFDDAQGAKAVAPTPVHAAGKADKPMRRIQTASTEAALEPAPAPTPIVRTVAARSLLPEIRQFCTNNALAAGAARIAWQAAKLTELDTKLKQRIAELETKRAEYEAWLKKREEALNKAQDDVVAIYAKMPAEAAASQLAAMDDEMAAAVLAKLNSRVAGAILAEMDPDKAAHLTNAMLGSATAGDGKKS
jgi:flagellar motility protein MotE (MotC chaperone)